MSLGFIFFWNHIFSFRKTDLSWSCPDWRSWDSRPCLSPALCILCSSRRLRFPAPHIWHSGPGTELIWDSSDRWGLGWECYLVAPVVTLITDPDEGAGPHVGVTDHTLSIALLTQSTWGREILILILQPSSSSPLPPPSDDPYQWQRRPVFGKISSLGDAWPYLVALSNSAIVKCWLIEKKLGHKIFQYVSARERTFVQLKPRLAGCYKQHN